MTKENPDLYTKILAICNFDAYSKGLNFVLGEELTKGRVATIYVPRLQEEFYGRKGNDKIFYERVIKESVHGLGHIFGLRHCANRKCAMYFSNSLGDTDIKLDIFCKNCKYLIKNSILIITNNSILFAHILKFKI
jgi:archaemetzincin